LKNLPIERKSSECKIASKVIANQWRIGDIVFYIMGTEFNKNRKEEITSQEQI